MRHLTLVGLLVGCLGCAGLWNAVSVGPFERQAERLLAQASVSDVRVRCRMHETTRQGWCELDGPRASLDAVLQGFGAQDVPADEVGSRHGDPCANLYRFSDVLGPVPVLALTGPLPPPEENVQVGLVRDNGSALCVAMQFPFG